ncbi:MAG: HNH endonuclease [Actinomycetota bacterium]|nr:HNH endonuclease [Actinomycetota bacterium]
MEAAGGTIGGLTAHRAQGPGAGGSASAPASDPFCVPSERGSLETCLALFKSSAITAAVDAALWNFQDASDFACRVEEISRTAEYLQLVAAHAIELARNEAMSGPSPAAGRSPADRPGAAGPGDDGCRNTVEFLRARLRISSVEARRRLALADTVLPRTGFAGAQLEPRYEKVGAAISSAEVSSRAGTTITLALEQVRRLATPARAAEMEQALTQTAVEHDADFLARVTKHWTDAIDQDGAEPGEECLRQLQGAFIRRPRHGLHHLEIFATTDQFENLVTVMNSATNPRTSGDAGGLGPDVGLVDAVKADAVMEGTATYPDVSLDHRSRAQKQLDGLVGACKSAMASASLPANGGFRPQVLATIDYRDLLAKVLERQQAFKDVPRGGSRSAGTASLAFTGPVNAATIRKIACDADIIPVVLGSEGRVLDIGRTSRIFPPHIRKAITARDQGCAFPGCTIPAPWCEAHHIQYWSRGGSTGTGNGVLLCSHHHHLIHKEQWQIEVTAEIPWFIPPPLLDPRQRPQRNLYFRSRPPRE